MDQILHRHDATASEIDPVCGMKVGPQTTVHRHTYQGRTYFFCSEGCRSKFAAELTNATPLPTLPDFTRRHGSRGALRRSLAPTFRAGGCRSLSLGAAAPRADRHMVGQQTDPLAPAAGRRRRLFFLV